MRNGRWETDVCGLLRSDTNKGDDEIFSFSICPARLLS